MALRSLEVRQLSEVSGWWAPYELVLGLSDAGEGGVVVRESVECAEESAGCDGVVSDAEEDVSPFA